MITGTSIGGIVGAGLTIGAQIYLKDLEEKRQKQIDFKGMIIGATSGMEVAAARLSRKHSDYYDFKEILKIYRKHEYSAQRALFSKDIPEYLKEVWPRYIRAAKQFEKQIKRHWPDFHGFVYNEE